MGRGVTGAALYIRGVFNSPRAGRWRDLLVNRGSNYFSATASVLLYSSSEYLHAMFFL